MGMTISKVSPVLEIPQESYCMDCALFKSPTCPRAETRVLANPCGDFTQGDFTKRLSPDFPPTSPRRRGRPLGARVTAYFKHECNRHFGPYFRLRSKTISREEALALEGEEALTEIVRHAQGGELKNGTKRN